MRIPKHEEAACKFYKEVKLLCLLKGYVAGITVPQLSFYEDRDGCFTIHELIPGERVETSDYHQFSKPEKHQFAKDIAHFMAALHDMNKQLFLDHDIPIKRWDRFNSYSNPGEMSAFYEAYEVHFQGDDYDYAQNFLASFESPTFLDDTLVFGHCDIMPKNVAYDFEARKLKGIFDFGDCGYVHPLEDFSQNALDWPLELVRFILEYYAEETGIHYDLSAVNDLALYGRLGLIERRIRTNRLDFKQGFERLHQRINEHKKGIDI